MLPPMNTPPVPSRRPEAANASSDAAPAHDRREPPVLLPRRTKFSRFDDLFDAPRTPRRTWSAR